MMALSMELKRSRDVFLEILFYFTAFVQGYHDGFSNNNDGDN